MSTYDDELRECLAIVLGDEAPPPDDSEALRFYGQWLASRNLGLVPIADAHAFHWPGHWLARVRAADGDHVVVMYGSPSGPLHDRAGALAGGGTIEEGWLLARLDVHLPIDRPYGTELGTGAVEAILVAPAAEQPLRRVESAQAVAGRGLEGDRYHDRRGTFGPDGLGYELTLVDAGVLDDVGLAWEDARRNVVTRGIDLNALVGCTFKVGGVICVGRRLAEPCAHLERLTRPGLMRPLVHRAGLRADIVAGGVISVGDAVEAA